MSILVERARRGERIDLIAKIEAETDLEVLKEMQIAKSNRREQLTMEQLQAFARRRAELRRK